MNILSITAPDLSNGLGCRITIWVAGCNHKCPGCHNQETWDYAIGTDINDINNFEEIYSVISKELNKSYIQGITLTGGDPLAQSDENLKVMIKFIERIKFEYPDKDIWVYSGDTFENLIDNAIKKEYLQLCDVLVDGPFIIKLKGEIPFRGSSNQRIIDLKKSFKENKVIEFNL